MAALRRAGHRVGLLAPGVPGRALVGPGDSEVTSLTPLDGPETAGFLGGQAASGSLADALRADVVLAFTESADLRGRLAASCPEVFFQPHRPEPGLHASTWLAAPTRRLGGDPGPEPPLLLFTPEERRAAERVAAPLPPGFLAVHPGSGSPAKNWPVDRFTELVPEHAGGRPWLLVAGPADEDAVAPLSVLPGSVPVRNVPIRVLGALLGRAGLYIGNDSGVSHLAAAAGAPTLALYGPTDPAAWSPVGPVVETVRSPNMKMEGLDLRVVTAAAARLKKVAEY